MRPDLDVPDLQARIRRLERELELAGRRELGALLALGAVHDTSNMLTAARIALAEWVGETGAAARADAHVALDRAGALMREVLRLVKHGAGPATVQVNQVVKRMVPLARLLGSALVPIDLALGELAPLTIDELELERVILNLLANAIAASPPHATIRLETAQTTRAGDPREFVTITVIDRGAGMSAEARRHALDALYTSRAGGTGLGLAIVLLLLARHDGFVELESEAQRGTTARVWLPITRVG